MDIDLSGYSHRQDSHVDQPTISAPSFSAPFILSSSILIPSIAAPCSTSDLVDSILGADEFSFKDWSSTLLEDLSYAEATLAEPQDGPSLSCSATTTPGDNDFLSSVSSVSLDTSSCGILTDPEFITTGYVEDDFTKNGSMDLAGRHSMSFIVRSQKLDTSSSLSPTSLTALTPAELGPNPVMPAWQGDLPMMMQANRSPNPLLPAPALLEMPYDPMCLNGDFLMGAYPSFVSYSEQLQDSQNWRGIRSEPQWRGSSHSHTSASSVGCSSGMSNRSLKTARRRHFSNSDALYTPTTSAHLRRHSASSSTVSPGTSRKAYTCKHAECSTSFSRQADLDRHNDHIHTEDGKKKQYRCDYDTCSRASTPFFRKDHFRDHLRDQHKEDIVKRGSNANQTVRRDLSGDRTGNSKSGGSISARAVKMETSNDSDDASRIQTQHRELEDCSTEEEWWRCSRCLDRVDIQSNGWVCPKCKGRIETPRFNLRAVRQAYQEAGTHISPCVKEEDGMGQN